MPYVSENVRHLLDNGRKATIAGELNYQISKLVNDFFAMKGLSYSTINDAIGALECAKLELYRRIASPYEDKKMAANGEVYVFQEEKA